VTHRDSWVRWWEKALAFFLVAYPIEVFTRADREWGFETLLAIAAVFAALLMVAVVWPRRRGTASSRPPPGGSGPAAR
jgi:hypothetical protein